MFSQQQDGRQAVPAMHMQTAGVQQTMPAQLQTMQVQINSQQQMGAMQVSSNVPQQAGLGAMQRTLGAIGPQHSVTGTGVPHQVDITGQARQMNPSGQPNVVIKTEVGTAGQVGPTGMVQRMPAPAVQPGMQAQPKAHQEGQTAPSQSLQQYDRIIKFKQLLPQLKECLVNLISAARQNFAANATIDSLEKSVDTSRLDRFEKALEQFFSICNLIERHLMEAHDQISHTLYSTQYAPMNANQLRESTIPPNAHMSYIVTVQQQLKYAKDIQNMLTESSDKILARQAVQKQQLQQQQQSSQNLQQRQLF